MNNPNPFVPKGSLLEQQSQRRSRLKIVVGCVVAISSLSLVAMLIQGCHREAPEAQAPVDTNTPAMDTNIPAMDTNVSPTVPMAPSNTMAAVPVPPPVAPPVVVPPVEPSAAGTEYTIVSGDTLAKIAKKNGVTVKAIEAANPGVDPKRLKPGKKLTIPAGGTPAAPTAGAASTMGTSEAGGEPYVVKSGDTLTKIAKSHGVTVKALRAVNPKIASTDHIHVGDKLTIPAKAETAAPATTPDTSTVPVAPSPAPAPAPVSPAPTPAPGR